MLIQTDCKIYLPNFIPLCLSVSLPLSLSLSLFPTHSCYSCATYLCGQALTLQVYPLNVNNNRPLLYRNNNETRADLRQKANKLVIRAARAIALRSGEHLHLQYNLLLRSSLFL